MSLVTKWLFFLVACCRGAVPPSVMFDSCEILGKWDPYNLNVAQFNSIPYTQPPVNDLRWEPPMQILNYSNTPNICQNNNMINATYHHSRCWSPWQPVGNYPPQNENCVHLDIYSPSFPSSSAATSLPTMVYFHGGSSFTGGNFQYDFTNFSYAEQIVVVVPNYRLGIQGFLAFEALTNISSTTPKQSGNYGLMDLKLSLQWVKQHIKQFGGNPDDITIMGQSTGGTAVIAMLAMPSVKGLFNRAISLSGSPNISMDLPTAEKQGQSIVELFDCDKKNYNSNDIVSCMKAVSAENLTNNYPESWIDADDKNFGLPGPSKNGFDEAGLMIVDGFLVTETIFNALEMGVIDVPLLIGNTQYETDFSPYRDVTNLTTEPMFAEYLNKQFIEWGPNFGVNLWKTHYTKEWDLGGSQLVYDGIATDSTGFCGSRYISSIAANSINYKSNVYLYSHQQWPSHTYPARTTWNCSYSFHSIGFQAATFGWLSFEYWGTLYYEPQFSDIGYGKLLRDHWNSFILNNKPLDNWKPFNKENDYSVALLGSGPNRFTEYNLTNSTANYKSDICKYYLDNGIGATFWWSN